ncbi:MAG: 2-C-methyl-D-erythritol 4-phosphate cytidylyltransferase [Candidatus Kapaibacteriota bacterium]|jgi:2-C-methyl-D-erythritol 4-phosphate cytidylyltransferase
MSVTVIISAGGVGNRFGDNTPKQFLDLNGKPIIIRTIEIFEKIEAVDNIVVAVNSEWFSKLNELIKEYHITKVKEVIIGGKTRQASVYNAIRTTTAKESEVILIHDAVRPLVSADLINKMIEEVEEYGAVIPALKVKDTIKSVTKGGNSVKTLERDSLYSAQTPQVFWFDIISNSFDSAMKNNSIVSDDSALVELSGYKVRIIEGEEMNIKITTQLDLKIAELILAN